MVPGPLLFLEARNSSEASAASKEIDNKKKICCETIKIIAMPLSFMEELHYFAIVVNYAN